MKKVFVVDAHLNQPHCVFENRADAEELALAIAEEELCNEFNYLMSVYPSVKGRLERIETQWENIRKSNRSYQVVEYMLFTND